MTPANENEIYAYHPDLANVLLADGSVQSLRASLAAETLIRLVTPSRGEVIDPGAF